MPDAQHTVETLVNALSARNLDAALATYAHDAIWEYHVPGGEGVIRGRSEVAGALYPWFIARDRYQIVAYQLVSDGDTVALRMEQHWDNDADHAPCVCHHSHFFQVAGGRIQRQWMYCTGVNVVPSEQSTSGIAIEEPGRRAAV